MPEVTHILQLIEQGDPKAAEELLPLVYQELRKLAAAKMAHQPEGQTLQATALVHEAWLRLVDVPDRAASGQEVLTLKGHTGGVNSVAFSPDGQQLASAGFDQTV
jgi:WD40 repeat protein